MEKRKIQQTIYLSPEMKLMLDEVSMFYKKLHYKISYGEIVSNCIVHAHDIVTKEYFKENPLEYPVWKKRWGR